MRILLIGKYPPCQGGVAARYYWLYKGLAYKYGWEPYIVTMTDPPYVTPPDDFQYDMIPTTVVPTIGDASPWVVPNVDLAVERLVTAALESADLSKPDVIECNYLAPFAAAAKLVSNYLNCPMIIRPAGSDIAKLLGWDATRRGLIAALRSAAMIFLPHERVPLFQQVISDLPHVTQLPRYVPDPIAFAPAPLPAKQVVLIMGKINYHWRLKALDTLLFALEEQPNWLLHIAVDGLYRREFIDLLNTRIDPSRYVLNGFVHPSVVPNCVKNAQVVWNVHRLGSVEDFPNTHWEALAVGRYSVVSPLVAKHPDMAKTRTLPFVIEIDPDNAEALGNQFAKIASVETIPTFSDLNVDFNEYLLVHRNAYESIR